MSLTLFETPGGRRAKRYDHFSDLALFDLSYQPRHRAVEPQRPTRLRTIAVSAGLALVGAGFLALAAAHAIGGIR